MVDSHHVKPAIALRHGRLFDFPSCLGHVLIIGNNSKVSSAYLVVDK